MAAPHFSRLRIRVHCIAWFSGVGDTCGGPPPRVPPTRFSTIANSARDLIYRGFVGGQMLSVSCTGPCSTKLTSSAATAHALSIGSMSATLIDGQRQHDLTFSTLNNQISGTTTFVNAWCPGMTVAVSTSIKGPVMVPSMLWLPRGRHNRATLLCNPSIDKSIDSYFTRSINAQTQVGAHVSYFLERKLKAIRFGGSHVCDSQTLVKWKLEDTGTAAGPLQYSPNSQVTCGLAAAMDFKNLSQAPTVGYSLQVLPNL